MIAALLLVAFASPPPVAAVSDSFPHSTHRQLFTSCRLCHSGIITGDSAQARPSSAACASCHDGTNVRTVEWTPTPARPSNLKFDHRRHFAASRDSTANETSCRGCHAARQSASFMEVARARPENCISCHQHQAEAHLAAENRCSTCHVPLTEATRLASETIARFPKPATHDSGFVLSHKDLAQDPARCQVCHSRDFCASCHVNAARIAQIQQLDSDTRVAQLVRTRTVTYRAPPSHAASDFTRRHGLLARADVQSCSSCHARESCQICHSQSPLVSVIAALPSRASGATGVDLSGLRPPGHLPGFRTNHREVAAGGDASCSRCHQQTFCATCHAGALRPVFHPVNFVTRHASSAFNSTNECATCHQVQVFCRDCHRRTGTSVAGRSGSASVHNAQPNWLFGHSGAARRSLESCVSCHQQSFCLQCHSASTGWRISPHGKGFEPAMGGRNAAMCRICHTQGPPS